MSSDFDVLVEDPVIFQRKDAAGTLVGFFFITVVVFLVLYLIIVWEKTTMPSAYSSEAWSYDGQRGFGPNRWSRIVPDRHDSPNQCGSKWQSPIAINTTDLPRYRHALGSEHQPLGLRLINYNDPVDSGQVRVDHEQLIISNMTGNRYVLDVNGIMYRLTEIYLRFGRHSFETEHSIDGEPSALEIQFLHYRPHHHHGEKSSMLALSSLFQVSSHNNNGLQGFLEALESYPGVFGHLCLGTLLPKGQHHEVTRKSSSSPYDIIVQSYVTYRGSLTVPPCTQNVRWYILRESVNISLSQLRVVRSVPSSRSTVGDNCRPPQPLNNRSVEVVLAGTPLNEARLPG